MALETIQSDQINTHAEPPRNKISTKALEKACILSKYQFLDQRKNISTFRPKKLRRIS